MTVKTGQAWAGTFVTLDATGALAAGSPAGALYVDGVADAAAVTITGSNPYKWAVTLPTLTAGQRVDMYITATIDTIATAGIVASAQADTVLVSDIVGADSDTLETLSDQLDAAATASSITALDGKIDTIDNFLDTEVAAILADTDEIQAELADGGRTDLLIDAIKAKTDVIPASPAPANEYDARMTAIQAETAAILVDTGTTLDTKINTIDGIVDDIKLKTDLIPAAPAESGEYTAAIAALQTDLDNPDQYKADVSTLATSAALATVDANVDKVVDATTGTGVLLKDDAIIAIFNDIVVTGSYTFAELMKIMASALAGELSGGGSTTLTFKSVDGASDVIEAIVDANGNRTSVTLTV